MRGFVGIIVALMVVSLITGGFYVYLQKQIPEIPKISEKQIPTAPTPVPVPAPKTTPTPAPASTPITTPVPQPLIQKCADGTLYGQCSINKPQYCSSGILTNSCGLCGCGTGFLCQNEGSCTLLPPLFTDITTAITVSVLDLSYIPAINGKVDISKTGDWQNEDINALINNIDGLRNGLADTLEKGSIYHGYKNQSATPSLNYEIYEKKIFYDAVPISPQFRGMDNAPSADHLKILNNLNICDYVENKGVKEVWIWMYHTPQVSPIESNMAGPYGDISNSLRENDMPVCQKTYVTYDYNYGRSYSMALEDHDHQIEAILNYADNNLFWNIFVGANGSGGRCGWSHYPPNGRRDYDWNNEAALLSDCEDWKPDGSGQKKYINCYTWSANASSCDADEGLSFKRWWMQNIPGKNNGLTYNGQKLKNWWIFIGDFDKAIRAGKSLTY